MRLPCNPPQFSGAQSPQLSKGRHETKSIFGHPQSYSWLRQHVDVLSSEKKAGAEAKRKCGKEEVGGAAQFISLDLGCLIFQTRNTDCVICRSSPVLTLYESKYQRNKAEKNCGPSLPELLIASLILNNVLILLKLMCPLSAKFGGTAAYFPPNYHPTKLNLIFLFFGKRIICIYWRNWEWGRGAYEGPK